MDFLDQMPPAWSPHVYIVRCAVNEPVLAKFLEMGRPDIGEPDWLQGIRALLRPADGDIRALRSLPFVKVGSTYQRNPSGRTRRVASGEPDTTMTCLGVPIVGVRAICYIPGQEELERALHARWQDDRIDPGREFFWVNDEMRDVAGAYVGRDPMAGYELPGDPFSTPPGGATWWGESAPTVGAAFLGRAAEVSE